MSKYSQPKLEITWWELWNKGSYTNTTFMDHVCMERETLILFLSLESSCCLYEILFTYAPEFHPSLLPLLRISIHNDNPMNMFSPTERAYLMNMFIMLFKILARWFLKEEMHLKGDLSISTNLLFATLAHVIFRLFLTFLLFRHNPHIMF